MGKKEVKQPSPLLSLDYDASYFVHKKLSPKFKESKLLDSKPKRALKKMLHVLFKVMSLSNNGFAWIVLGPLMIVLSYTFFPPDTMIPRPTPILWNNTWYGQLMFHFAIEAYRLRFLAACLFLDLVFVGCMKLYARRDRPDYGAKEGGSRRWSFPSGHSSRAAILIILWCFEKGDSPEFFTFKSALVFGYCILMGLARISLARHFITDVFMGYVIGSVEVLAMLSIKQYVPLFNP